MPTILETQDFLISAHDRPHHSRENGGHIVVWPKSTFEHLHDMPPALASDYMQLLQLVGQVFISVMRRHGVNAVRVNYATFGNWEYKSKNPKPKLHTSLYLRSWGEKHPSNDPHFQAFPEALYLPDRSTGYYDSFQPLRAKECADIKAELLKLLETEQYQHLL